MPPEAAPESIRALADARAQARRIAEWGTADRLKAEIEAAGWRVVDTGTMYDLVRGTLPVVVEDDVLRYGTSVGVASRLDEPASGIATVVLVASQPADDAVRLIADVVHFAPAGTAIIVVANGLDRASEVLVETACADGAAAGVAVEIIRTTTRLGRATALNAGIRRATAPVVVLLDRGVTLRGDAISPLVSALDDPAVGIAGAVGLVTEDLRRFDPAPGGSAGVDALAAGLQAFRRADYVDRGPLDERFVDDPWLDPWWSFVLRDPYQDPAMDEGAVPAPRLAVVVGDVPVATSGPGQPAVTGEGGGRKGMYRFLKRFATREDLRVAAD